LAIGLHGDKTMFTNANVRPANDAVWSAAGATRALTEGNGASETSYRRPHAPRSDEPENGALTGIRFDISSTQPRNGSSLRSTVRRAMCRSKMTTRLRGFKPVVCSQALR
jgi:hypothetical protein